MPTIFITLGALLAALAVGLGAIGAHALKSQLSPEQLATYHTAVQYQMYHAIGLVLVGLLGLQQRSRWFAGAGWAMLAGILSAHSLRVQLAFNCQGFWARNRRPLGVALGKK